MRERGGGGNKVDGVWTFKDVWPSSENCIGLQLYEALELLGQRELYFDADSVVYLHVPDQPDPVLGDNLGDFKDELEGGDYIVEFCSSGPKNYWYQTRSRKTVCKVRGFSLNIEGIAQLNYQVLKENTLDEVLDPLPDPRRRRITQTFRPQGLSPGVHQTRPGSRHVENLSVRLCAHHRSGSGQSRIVDGVVKTNGASDIRSAYYVPAL